MEECNLRFNLKLLSGREILIPTCTGYLRLEVLIFSFTVYMFMKEKLILWYSFYRKWHPFRMPPVDTIYPYSLHLELLTPKTT